tara:strand:+ start:529 stop:774 length:246 start_codon:yes stop_codon:yes gene_type:complete
MFIRLKLAGGEEINVMIDHVVGFGPVKGEDQGGANIMLSTNQTIVVEETPRTLRARIKKELSSTPAQETAEEASEEKPVEA